MFDHVKFGVTDYTASKAFFLKALEPLGVAIASEGPRPTASNFAPQASRPSASSKPPKNQPTSTWPSKPKPASK